MSRKTLLVLAMILTAGLAWAKPELGLDGRPLPPHLRHKEPQAQKQQPVNLRQQPGRPNLPGHQRQAGAASLKSKPVRAANALPKESIKAVIKDEFLVNDDVLGVGYYAGYQYEPKVAALPSGEMMLVWYDYRNSWNYQVFGRCYDACGNPVGADFLVNEFTGQYADCPAVTACGNGFLVTWEDYRNGNDYDIYAQRYDATGSPIGGNFLVSDDVSGYDQYYPSAAANDSGFIITWEDWRSGIYWEIYAQRYDASGLPIGGNFLVNEAGSYNHYQYGAGNISASDNGFVITWYDYRSGSSWDVYAQRLDADGDTLGGNFLVNDGSSGNEHYNPCVAASDSGFVIAWYDYRNGNWDIYAQRYSANGDTLGGNFLVNDDASSYDQYEPKITASDSGFVITWYDYRSGSNYDIYAQRFNAAGDTMDGNFMVNDDMSGNNHYYPSVAASDSGFVIAWYDDRYNSNGYYDIFCQRYDVDGDTLGSNFMVNSDSGTSDQWDAATAMDASGNSVVVWYDLRSDDGTWNTIDIYAQRYDSLGNPLGTNFVINDTLVATRYVYDPKVAFLPGGGLVVTWYDYRNSGSSWDIYAQLFDSSGTAVGGNFLVNDDGGSNDQYCPDVAAGDSGFMITWYDYRNSNADIYAQRYDTLGMPVSGNFRVDNGGNYQSSPHIATNGNGYVIAWEDSRIGSYYQIYAQRFDVNGDTLGGNFLVGDGDNTEYGPSVAMGDSGFVIAWYDYRYDGSYTDIYAQQYKLNGDTIGGNFIVNDDPQGVVYHYNPSVAMSPDEHNVVIAWEDYRNDPSGYVAEIMAQKYVDGVPVGGNVVVNGTTMSNRYFWGGKRMACTDQRILFNWDDNRRQKGMDIYAKLTDWDLQHIQDAIPPYIVSTSPSNGATGVALNEPVVVAFSEPMDTLSINGYAIPTDNYNLSWNATGDTMTLTPGTPYNYSTTYSVIVTAGKDTSGNNLVTLPDTFVTFTTIDNQGPVLSICTKPSDTYQVSGPFTIKAVITDPVKNKSLTADTLYYTDGNTAFKTAGVSAGSDTFEFAITDTFTPGTIIGYQVKTWDEVGAVAVEPVSGVYQFRILNPLPPNALSGNGTGAGSIMLTWNPPMEDLDYTSKVVDLAVAGANIGDQFAVKITPQYTPCKLTEAKIIFYSLAGQVEVHVWSDSSGIPGHDLMVPQVISVTSFYPDTTYLPIDVTVNGECHIGIRYLSEPFSYVTTDNEDLTGRSQYFNNQTGTWQTMGQLLFGDLFIITTAQYGPESKAMNVSSCNTRSKLPALKAPDINGLSSKTVASKQQPQNYPKNFYNYVVEGSVSSGAWYDCGTVLGLTNTQTGLLNYTYYDYRIRAFYHSPDTISYSNVLSFRTDFNGPAIMHIPPVNGDTGNYVFFAEISDSSGISSDTMCYYYGSVKKYSKGGGPSVPDTAIHDSITDGNRYWYHINASYYDTMKYYFTFKDSSLWFNKTISPLYSFSVETGVAGLQLQESYSLYLAYVLPNPIRNSAEFRFGLSKEGQASLDIFNVLGQRVKTLVKGFLSAGNHTVKWNGCDDNGKKVSSGVYVYRLTAGDKTFTRRFTVIR